MAATQNQFPFTLGFNPNYLENGGSLDDTFNTATTWTAFGFNLANAKTLNEVRLYCVSKTGTPSGMTVELWSASGTTGAPNAMIESKTLNPTAAAWNDWTGFTTALSANTQYYIVIKNATATPASHFAVMRRIAKMDYAVLGGNRASIGSAWGWCWRYTDNSGASWANGNGSGGHAGMRLKFSDSTYAGIPVSAVVRDTSNEIYGTRMAGVYLTIPSTWPTIKVAGISMVMNNQGSAPTQMAYKVYTGAGGSPSLLDTTQIINDENFQGDCWVPLYFATPITLSPNQTIRIVACAPDSSGSSGNTWCVQRYTWDTDAGSRTLLPLSLKGTYNGTGSYVENDANVAPFVLILDNAGEFAVSASGGLLRHPGMNGGLSG